MPFSNVDTYTRKLKDEGVFPATGRGRGGSKLDPEHAAMALFAIMRGSPVNAASNAVELGSLKPHDIGGDMTAPILEAKLDAIGWTKDTTLQNAIASIIALVANGSIGNIFGLAPGEVESPFTLTIDKYWTKASLFWYPNSNIIAAWEDACASLSKNMKRVYAPDRLLNGYLSEPMAIRFHSPLLRDQEITYFSGDKDGNRLASQQFMEIRKEASKYDVHGDESISMTTIEALAALFEKDGD